MNSHYIPPHPLLERFYPDPEDLGMEIPEFKFSSTAGENYEPNAIGGWGGVVTFGTDSSWQTEKHDLSAECTLKGGLPFAPQLFGPNKLVCADAELALILQWTSVDSGQRGASDPVRFTRKTASEIGEIKLCLNFPAGTVRGAIQISLQLILSASGKAGEGEWHLANTQGYRLGQVGADSLLILDGDGSLFPIIEVSLGEKGALWEFRGDWVDAGDEDFSAEAVSLAINTQHPFFNELIGDGRTYETLLFRQVLASWLTIFLLKVSEKGGGSSMFEGRKGSIAWVANWLVSTGDLRLGSAEELSISAQKWIEKMLRVRRGATE